MTGEAMGRAENAMEKTPRALLGVESQALWQPLRHASRSDDPDGQLDALGPPRVRKSGPS